VAICPNGHRRAHYAVVGIANNDILTMTAQQLETPPRHLDWATAARTELLTAWHWRSDLRPDREVVS
jgi:hypothetical protein